MMFSKKNVQLCIIFGLIFMLTPGIVKADEVNSEKKDAFLEFFVATGAEAQYSNMINIMMNQFQVSFMNGFKQVSKKIERENPEKRKKLLDIMDRSLKRYISRMRVEIEKGMPFSELIDNVYYPVYDKKFNISELKTITEFYESPVGKKFVRLTPKLMQDSIKIYTDHYGKKLEEISFTIAEQEFQKIKTELNKLKNKKQ